jgi:hypothetical protein
VNVPEANIVDEFIAVLNVAVIALLMATPMAALAGTVEITVGATFHCA